MPSKKISKPSKKTAAARLRAPVARNASPRPPAKIPANLMSSRNWYAHALLDPEFAGRGSGVPDIFPIPTHRLQTVIDVPIPRLANGRFAAVVTPDMEQHVLLETGGSRATSSATGFNTQIVKLHTHHTSVVARNPITDRPINSDVWTVPNAAYVDVWNMDALWCLNTLQDGDGHIITARNNTNGNAIRCQAGDNILLSGQWRTMGMGTLNTGTFGNFRVTFADSNWASLGTVTDAGSAVVGSYHDWVVTAPANAEYITRIEFQDTGGTLILDNAIVRMGGPSATSAIQYSSSAVPQFTTYKDHFDGYRLVGMSALATFVGSVTTEGGLIAARCFPSVVNAASASVPGFDYESVASRAGSYRGAVKDGAYAYWKPMDNRDLEFKSLESSHRLGDSSFLIVAGTLTETAGSVRLRVVANWEAITHSQLFAPVPSPVSPHIIWHALELLATAPTAFENHMHLLRIKEILQRAGLAAAKLAWNNRGRLAGLVADATGNPELSAPAAAFASALPTPRLLR